MEFLEAFISPYPCDTLKEFYGTQGAGATQYSRMADGRAVMRSSLRELVASEAMHALGVPTTRALSLVATGDQVLRDMFYKCAPANLPRDTCKRPRP